MKQYDGIQPVLSGWDKAIFDTREAEIISILVDLDSDINVQDIYIGEIREDRNEGDESEVAFYVDFLCDMLEVPPTKWLDHFVCLDYESIGKSKVTDKSEMAKLAGNLSIGQFTTEFAYRLLPIEYDESGEMSLDLQLANPGGVNITLKVSGDFDTAYAEQEGEDSSVDYTIRFDAGVIPPALPHSSV